MSLINEGWDSVIGIAVRYGLDGVGTRGFVFTHFQTGPKAHQVSSTMGTRVVSPGWSGWGVALTTTNPPSPPHAQSGAEVTYEKSSSSVPSRYVTGWPLFCVLINERVLEILKVQRKVSEDSWGCFCGREIRIFIVWCVTSCSSLMGGYHTFEGTCFHHFEGTSKRSSSAWGLLRDTPLVKVYDLILGLKGAGSQRTGGLAFPVLQCLGSPTWYTLVKVYDLVLGLKPEYVTGEFLH
jgi:hypothetical protein